ncbi:MAG: CAP domain-containing protein, partial [Sedimentibacter sp.]
MKKKITAFTLVLILVLSKSSAFAAINYEFTSPSNLGYEERVVQLVNIEREKYELPSLYLDKTISDIARMKSKDMADKNYFGHQSPTYGSAGEMLLKFGVTWSAWGENIASGQRSPEQVVS